MPKFEPDNQLSVEIYEEASVFIPVFLLYSYDFDLHPGTVSHPKRLYIISSIDREA